MTTTTQTLREAARAAHIVAQNTVALAAAQAEERYRAALVAALQAIHPELHETAIHWTLVGGYSVAVVDRMVFRWSTLYTGKTGHLMILAGPDACSQNWISVRSLAELGELIAEYEAKRVAPV